MGGAITDALAEVFARLIRSGAKRISSVCSSSQLLTTAFKNKDGKNVVVVMNQSNLRVPYFLWVGGKAAEVVRLPHSIATLIFQ